MMGAGDGREPPLVEADFSGGAVVGFWGDHSLFAAAAPAEVICRAVRASPFLRRVDVSSSELGTAREEGGRPPCGLFVDAVAEWLPGVREICLANNGLGDDSAAAVAALIRRCPSLRSLVLSHNWIAHAGCRLLAAELGACRLECVNLTRNPIGDLGLEALLRAVYDAGDRCALSELHANVAMVGTPGAVAAATLLRTGRSNLRTVALNGNNIAQDGASALLWALEQNLTLRTLELYGNDFPYENVRAAADALLARNERLAKLVGAEAFRLLALGRATLLESPREPRKKTAGVAAAAAAPEAVAPPLGRPPAPPDPLPPLSGEGPPGSSASSASGGGDPGGRRRSPALLDFSSFPREIRERILLWAACAGADAPPRGGGAAATALLDARGHRPPCRLLTDRQARLVLNYAADRITLGLAGGGADAFLERVQCERWRG